MQREWKLTDSVEPKRNNVMGLIFFVTNQYNTPESLLQFMSSVLIQLR